MEDLKDQQVDASARVDLTELEKDDFSGLKDLCIKHVPFWASVSRGQIRVKLMAQVLTNRLYRADLMEGDSVLHSLIVKRFNVFGSVINNADTQIETFELLGENDLGPRIFYRFRDVIIQEFIVGNTLERLSLLNLSCLTSMASELARFHKSATAIAPPHWDRNPVVLRTVNTWLPEARKVVEANGNFLDIDGLERKVGEFRAILDAHLKASDSYANKVLFCHNDLYYKNLLNTPHGVRLIDFDYAGFNYVGAEVAKVIDQLDIQYMEDDDDIVEYDVIGVTDEMKAIFAGIYLSEALEKNVLPSDEMVKDFLTSVRIHTLGSALFWSLWGLLMLGQPVSVLNVPQAFYRQYSKLFLKYYDDVLSGLKKDGLV
ncbi:choline/ethanolamine kinase, putative [Theileria equi strain WA]|uniref:Choline/ethanolamine kinase, putative n=1 Tax=Theileria equi strain WA TaxID=1537102 RepID=L0B0E9_THEEQ|nr:choline/ethanolamine kinase, putative [Theileria equi strain WA]AFZ80963.1 choline/ethanolamine kinase, putative [Theileria equi strain WA]|eukprot:XP_004830629.1 choline/ethanolamine kinase, putative [Theileria equi strain WA]